MHGGLGKKNGRELQFVPIQGTAKHPQGTLTEDAPKRARFRQHRSLVQKLAVFG